MGFTFLGPFGWIVTSVNVAIGSDYFNRDALGWKRGGRIVAPVLLVVLYAVVSVPPWWLPAGTSGEVIGSVVNVATGAAFVGVILYAAGVLVITYLRIRDNRIKTFTKWTVLSILCVSLAIVLPTELLVFVAVPWALGMYRSVGSLAIKVRALPV